MTSPEPSLSSAELSAHAAYLRALARGLLGRGGEADDLVQDTFVAALEHPPRGGLRSWLATVARNRAIGLRRGASRRAAREADVARPEAGPDASEALERLELAQRLAAEVARLREPYRTAIYLRYHEGLAPSEIAVRLGEPVKTVKTRLARALELLRERLDAREGGREVWSATLLPFAFHRGAPLAPAPAVPLAALTGGLAVKKLAIALAAVVVFGLALQVVRGPAADSRAETSEPVGVRASAETLRAAPEPTFIDVASAPRTPLQVALEPARSSTGNLLVTLVWADDGAPAAEVCAEVEVLDGLVPRPDRIHVRADADGRARFEGLPTGRVRVYAPTVRPEVEIIVATETVEVRLELATGIVVEGRVVAPDGGAVGGAAIRSQQWDGQALLAHTLAHSRPDGTFRVRGLRDDEWLGATAPGWRPSLAFQPGDLAVGPRGAREVELELGDPGARLAGRVLDAEGAPLAGAQVLAGPRGGGSRNLPDGRNGIDAAPALLQTASDGTFEVLGDLEPGRQPVEVVAAGHPVWFGNVELREGERAWLEVQLIGPARIAGRVLDAEGTPRAGVRVIASREVGAHRFGDRTPVPTAFTDERGAFALDWVQPGEVEVRASDPKDERAGRARARVLCASGELREIELALDPEPAIRGRVVDGEGRPIAGWSVHSRTAEWLDMSPMHPGTMSVLIGLHATDADGRFVVPNVDDLPWNLSVAAPGEIPFPPRAALEGVRASDGEVEIVVERTAAEACVLVVRLADVDGRPPQDVQAALWDEQRTAGTYPEYDASTGVARWSVSLPGRYAVQVRRGARAVHHGEFVELRSGETVDLGEVRLGEPGELVVEVSGPEAWGLERVDVSVVPVGGIEELVLERDDLTFRVVALAPGRYVLRAGHKAFFAPEREVEVQPRDVTRVEVEFVPAFPLRVTFEFPDAVKEWRSVDWEVQDQSGSRVRSGHVRNWTDFPGTAAPGITGFGLPTGRYMLLATTDAGLRAELPLDVADAQSAHGPHVLAFRL